MNYVSFVVKLLNKSQKIEFKEKSSVIKTWGKISTIQNHHLNSHIKMAIWLLPKQYSDNFFVGDFLIIEGYISFRFNNLNQKYIEISVCKFNNLSTLI